MARILVIDDNQPVLDMLRVFLRMSGHEVSMASDGPAGLRLCEERLFDAALIDVEMPGMDGLAVCAALKRHVCTKHLPVLLMTGKPGLDVYMRAKRAGALQVFEKPFKVKEVLDVIAWCGASGAGTVPNDGPGILVRAAGPER